MSELKNENSPMERLKSLTHREIIAQFLTDPTLLDEASWRTLIGNALAVSAEVFQQKGNWSGRVNAQTEVDHEKTRPETARTLTGRSLEVKLNPDGKTLKDQLTIWYGPKKN